MTILLDTLPAVLAPDDTRAQLANLALTVLAALGAWVLAQARAWLAAHASDKRAQTAKAILDAAAEAGRSVSASTYADKAKAADELDPARAKQIALDAGKTLISGEALKLVSDHFGPQWAAALATAIEHQHASQSGAADPDAIAKSLLGLMSGQTDAKPEKPAADAPLPPIPDHVA